MTAIELLSGADIFLSNVRPAALRRIGLDYETVAAANPRLVYGLITGYGESGPDADRAAYDVAAFWARAGLAHLLILPLALSRMTRSFKPSPVISAILI